MSGEFATGVQGWEQAARVPVPAFGAAFPGRAVEITHFSGLNWKLQRSSFKEVLEA